LGDVLVLGYGWGTGGVGGTGAGNGNCAFPVASWKKEAQPIAMGIADLRNTFETAQD
jgi:hypothetical protein